MVASDVQLKGFGSACTVRGRKPGGRAVELGQLQLAVPGRHNVLNALAAVAMSRELGIAWSDIARGLGGFHGAERRFQRRGEARGVVVVEDYGHHPTEIAAVVAAARPIADGRLIVAFQPHRFTRTQFLLSEFGRAFVGADVVVLTEIYAAGEEPIEGVTLDALADAVRQRIRRRACVSCRMLSDVPRELAAVAKPGDLIVLLGAGSIGSIAGAVLRCARGSLLMPVTAPADRRFQRAHVKPARKRGAFTLRRLHTVVAGVIIALAVYAGYRAVAVVSGLDIFRIDRINVRGNHRLSNGEVLAMLENLKGRSVLAVDLAEWRRALLSSPWVADASLRRTLPSTVDVVDPRAGAARYRPHQRRAVSRRRPRRGHRRIRTRTTRTSTCRLSTVSRRRARNTQTLYRALLARRLLDALRVRNMASQISQIDVSDARNAVVLLEGDPTLIRLGNERFVERLQSYHELAPALREQVPAIDYVDLRFDERVYVRPARERRTPAAGAKTAPVKSARPTQTG